MRHAKSGCCEKAESRRKISGVVQKTANSFSILSDRFPVKKVRTLSQPESRERKLTPNLDFLASEEARDDAVKSHC
jgi:hypothetical protein